jgi:hypothetical protein
MDGWTAQVSAGGRATLRLRPLSGSSYRLLALFPTNDAAEGDAAVLTVVRQAAPEVSPSPSPPPPDGYPGPTSLPGPATAAPGDPTRTPPPPTVEATPTERAPAPSTTPGGGAANRPGRIYLPVTVLGR